MVLIERSKLTFSQAFVISFRMGLFIAHHEWYERVYAFACFALLLGNLLIFPTITFSSDKTSVDRPYIFWLNDNQDDREDTETVPVQIPDNADESIRTKRDLEDFQRIAIRITPPEAIRDPTISVALKWKNVVGSPSVRIYKAYVNDPGPNGMKYLEDDAIATQQISGEFGNAKATIAGTNPVVLDKSLFLNLTNQVPYIVFLFEGVQVGKGSLTFCLMQNKKIIVESELLYMDLRKVTDMYSQVQALPVEGIADPYQYFPEQPPFDPGVSWQDTTSTNFQKPVNETNQCIVFVHGWNVSDKRFYQQANSMFKRLWLQGFKGRFVAFRWPSVVSGEEDPDWWSTIQNAEHYFEIEHRGFKYGKALKQYVEYLVSPAGGGFTVHVIGHSMGNIVVSEALKQGAPISEYVLLDAAVSAGCYDTQDELINPSIGEPLTVPDFAADGGYRGYFIGLSGLTNFYNSDDEALVSWEDGNLLKRDFVFLGGMQYFNEGGVKLKKLQSQPPSFSPPDPRSVNDIHESMAMFAVSRTRTVGVEARTRGAVLNPIDLKTFFSSENKAHSAPFDLPIQYNGTAGVKACYQEILRRFKIPFNP